MIQLCIGTATGFLGFGAACLCGMRRFRKESENCPQWVLWGIPGIFLLLFALTFLGLRFLPAAEMFRQAEQVSVLAGVAYCALTDLRERLIPDRAVLALSCAVLAFCAAEVLSGEDGGRSFWLDRVLGLLLAFAVPGIAGLFVKGGIGGGDLKLLSVLGFSYGLSGIVTVMFLSFLPCAVCGALMLAAGRGKRDTAVPFGPFLAFGAVLYTAILWF